MRIPYAIIACVIIWITASFLGPLLLLLRSGWDAAITESPFMDPSFIMRGLWAWGIVALLGFVFARRSILPSVFWKRYLPLLTVPLALSMLGMAATFLPPHIRKTLPLNIRFIYEEALYPAWDPILRYWDFWFYGPPGPLYFLQQHGLHVSFSDFDAFFLHSFFYDVSGFAGAMSLYAVFLLGFVGGAWQQTREGYSYRGAAPLLVLCLCVAGGMAWLEYDRRSNIVERRDMWTSPENHLPTILYSGRYLPDECTPFFSNSHIVEPDASVSLYIASNYPRLDGATAFFPLYAAAFKATIVPSGQETGKRPLVPNELRDLLACSTSREGYSHLINGKSDIFFALEPSPLQRKEAEVKGVRLRFVPIAKEAFVFFVHTDTPVNNLTTEQIRAVYTKKIRNWQELGGPNLPILPFQRPANSGSQTIMESVVMQGLPMARAPQEELIAEMGGLVNEVADYHNEARSLGYSFRWYVTKLYSLPNLKFLSVNGIAPTPETIESGAYPFIVPIYAVVREDSVTPEAEALLAWLTGPEGQALVSKVGYVPVTGIRAAP